MNKKPDKPARRREWWPLSAVLLTSPVLFLFAHFGYEDRGWAAWVFVLTIGLTLAAHWKWKRHVTFWIGAVVLVVLHIILVRLPWDSWKLHGRWPSLLALVDFACNVAVMQLILLAANQRRPADVLREAERERA